MEKFSRPVLDRVIGGVCSGIAYRMDIDPIWVRVIFAILYFQPIPIVVVYLIIWLLTPSDK